MSGRLVVVSGPSGVGKGTVIAELLRRRPDIWLSISTTTRQPRPGEEDGREYFFIGAEEFRRMADSQGFLEWAQYADNLYGTQRTPVDARISEETSVLLEIDLEGARQVRRNFPEALLVFIAPPDEAELERRLLGRGTESVEVARGRLARASEEMAAIGEFDQVFVNSEVTATVNELLAWCEEAGV